MKQSERISEQTVSYTWDKVWQESPVLDWEKDFISQLVYNTLKQELENTPNLKMLEAGCGTGRISIRLAGATRTAVLLDSSPAVLKMAQRFASQNQGNISIVNNSIYNICFKDNVFDLVWNAGVLEHFFEGEQKIIVTEMLRVCRNGGKIIILVPYSKAVFYRFGKWFREALKIWNLGREVPLKTLKNLQPDNGKLLREYVVGTSEQIFLLPKGFKKITKAVLDVLIRLGLGDLLKKIIGGYLLVSVFEKTICENP